MKNFFKNLFTRHTVSEPEKNIEELPAPLVDPELSPQEESSTNLKLKAPDDSLGSTEKEELEEDKEDLPPYEPTLDLSGYRYPLLTLLTETLRPIFAQLHHVQYQLPLIWGYSDSAVQIRDLAELQTVLIAGAPGTGKTTLVQQFVLSLLYKKHPSQLKFVMIEEKGLDFAVYQQLEKHFLAKLPGSGAAVVPTVPLAINTLNAVCIESDNRYGLLKEASVRNITEYNTRFINRELNPRKGHQFLPYIILVIDNLDSLCLQSPREIVMPLQKLITNGYKAGIFAILSTNDLSAKVLPTDLLSLIPTRLSFRLNSKYDYKKLFDTTRIDIPLERGAFHFNYAGKSFLTQAAFIAHEDVEAVGDFISSQKGYPMAFLLPGYVGVRSLADEEFDSSLRDSLFEDAARLIVQNQVGSTSLLQRRMKLGYNRAGMLMDQLEAASIVGPSQGSKARDVLIKTEIELERHLATLR